MTPNLVADKIDRIFRERAGVSALTRPLRRWPEGVRRFLTREAALVTGEQAVVAMVAGPRSWWLLTPSALVWQTEARRDALAPGQIERAGASGGPVRLGETELRRLVLQTRRGAQRALLCEPGGPEAALLAALRWLARRGER